MSSVDVSVQIVNYNSGQRIIETLNALIASTDNATIYEIIVVDNASVDGSPEIVEQLFPQVRLIRNPMNRFFSAAHNQAAKVARGRYLLILNSDITLNKGVMSELVAFLDKNADAGAITPAMYSETFKDQPDCVAWKEWSLLRSILYMNPQHELLVRLKLRKPRQAAEIKTDVLTEAEVVIDACLLVRKDLFYQIGMYDENMLLYCTEDDLCKRIRGAGYKILVLPFLRVYHSKGYTTKKSPKAIISRIAWRDNVYFFKKNFGALASFVVIIIGGLNHLYNLVIERVKALER